eukprot:TRINITY_DN9220_c0_g1_i1.p1 TRINITY_DN9220_c0_g1~~TRINITY_DN9220_c0_g1_i1.p1  ORF type:complete len:138 (-),score=29.32 TRINITY_DN9220_c0_g1_i1:126-539(-)
MGLMTSSKRILVVDDSELNHKILGSFLRRLGYENIQPAYNGQEALYALQKEHFDVIFLDVNMPILNGWETAKQIKNLSLPKAPIIIAHTTLEDPADKQKCYDSGMNHYISKPYRKTDIAQVLSELNKFRTETDPLSV